MHAYLQSRPLVYAVALSLGGHALLLLPWRYGDWLADGTFFSGKPVATPRLDVLLTQAAPKSREPSPAAAPESLPQTPREKISAPSAPPQREIDTAQKPAGIPLDALYYYAVNELDRRPLLKQVPQIDAASGARLMASGSAVLELLIERNGHINAVNVVRSDLPEGYLVPLKQAFAAANYSPGIKEQRQVRSRIYVEVAYQDGMFSGIDGASASVPPNPMGSAQANRQRKENPPLRN